MWDISAWDYATPHMVLLIFASRNLVLIVVTTWWCFKFCSCMCAMLRRTKNPLEQMPVQSGIRTRQPRLKFHAISMPNHQLLKISKWISMCLFVISTNHECPLEYFWVNALFGMDISMDFASILQRGLIGWPPPSLGTCLPLREIHLKGKDNHKY